MTIAVGERLPEAELLRHGANGPETVHLSALTKGRRIVLFGLPGAFTGVCTEAHMPSFIRTRADFLAKGIDEVVCVAVNDPFVLRAWGEATGATEAGITILGDAESGLVTAMGLDFTAPPVGLIRRSKRFSSIVEDGVVTVLNVEESPGMCEISAGETLLRAL